MAKKSEETVSLDAERGRKFLEAIAKDPFLAIVVDANGEVTVFSSKKLSPAHMERIAEALTEIQQEG